MKGARLNCLAERGAAQGCAQPVGSGDIENQAGVISGVGEEDSKGVDFLRLIVGVVINGCAGGVIER